MGYVIVCKYMLEPVVVKDLVLFWTYDEKQAERCLPQVNCLLVLLRPKIMPAEELNKACGGLDG